MRLQVWKALGGDPGLDTREVMDRQIYKPVPRREKTAAMLLNYTSLDHCPNKRSLALKLLIMQGLERQVHLLPKVPRMVARGG